MSWCSSQSQLSDKHLFCSSIHVVIVLAITIFRHKLQWRSVLQCMRRTFKPLLILLQNIHWGQRLAFSTTIQFLRNWFPGMSGGWIPKEIPNWSHWVDASHGWWIKIHHVNTNYCHRLRTHVMLYMWLVSGDVDKLQIQISCTEYHEHVLICSIHSNPNIQRMLTIKCVGCKPCM